MWSGVLSHNKTGNMPLLRLFQIPLKALCTAGLLSTRNAVRSLLATRDNFTPWPSALSFCCSTATRTFCTSSHPIFLTRAPLFISSMKRIDGLCNWPNSSFLLNTYLSKAASGPRLDTQAIWLVTTQVLLCMRSLRISRSFLVSKLSIGVGRNYHLVMDLGFLFCRPKKLSFDVTTTTSREYSLLMLIYSCAYTLLCTGTGRPL